MGEHEDRDQRFNDFCDRMVEHIEGCREIWNDAGKHIDAEQHTGMLAHMQEVSSRSEAMIMAMIESWNSSTELHNRRN